MNRPLALAMASALVFSAAACGSPDDGSEAEPGAATSSPTAPEEQASGPVESRPQPAHVAVEVAGAETISWEQTIDDLRVVTLTAPPDPSMRLLSVGLLDFEELEPGRLFRAAFDLVGVYTGKSGTFEIPASAGDPASGATPDPGAVVSELNNAFVIVAELDDPEGAVEPDNVTSVTQYERIVEPCSVEVEADEQAGVLDCPALADADGNTVSLRFTWGPPEEA